MIGPVGIPLANKFYKKFARLEDFLPVIVISILLVMLVGDIDVNVGTPDVKYVKLELNIQLKLKCF